jgi:hypothetical protein
LPLIRSPDVSLSQDLDQAHLHEQDDLLPSGQGAEVYGGQTADCYGTNAVVERIDIGDAILAIASVKYARKYEA